MPASENNLRMMTQNAIYAEEKAEGIQRWVFISIEIIPMRLDGSYMWYDRKRIYQYDLPRELYDRRKWVITWRIAKLQCQLPKSIVQSAYSFYCKKTKITLMDGPLRKRIDAKRMITTIKNKMKAAKDSYVPTLFKPSIEQTDEWKKALQKLSKYEDKLKALNLEIEKLQSMSNDKSSTNETGKI